jgi:subtilisin family serine protease
MHDAGFYGQGMTICVLDAGFYNVDRHECFTHLFTNNQIKGTYDFVKNSVGNVYRENYHGAAVLSIMGGYLNGKLIGPAYGADYYLFRTEDAGSEKEIECANWVIGAERADSLGCDLINSSLGYNTFDLSEQDYSLSDLNGKNTFISRAANIAASTGMLVVNSAGNTGGTGAPWFGKITMPSDADSVLTLGAVRLDGSLAGFSSRGPTATGHIKPDVVGPGAGVIVYDRNGISAVTAGSGTSYSSPIICGLAAGIWQAYPSLTAQELHDVAWQPHSKKSPERIRRIPTRATAEI